MDVLDVNVSAAVDKFDRLSCVIQYDSSISSITALSLPAVDLTI